MAKPTKPIKAFKHKDAKRAHIPSAEEAGYEGGNPKVRSEQTPRDFPLNPVVHRGQDPELFWLGKYREDASGPSTINSQPSTLSVDIRSLYRHEHIAPETIIKGLYKMVATEDAQRPDLTGFAIPELFGNAIGHEELDKVSDYYTHSDGWTNRLIQGDSLLVLTSLLEREGMAGQVQCLYFDPPYGIKYGSNWQIKLGNRTVTDGQDDSLSGEPEQIKAFRDTWELGIHSYLSYLRDRLLVARELLHDSGSCFVQISDENVHLVRCLMDEVFGSANFVSLISFKKTTSASATLLGSVHDYILWYARDHERVKYRQLFGSKELGEAGATQYTWAEMPDGTRKNFGNFHDLKEAPKGSRVFVHDNLTSQRPAQGDDVREFVFEGKSFTPGKGTFKTDAKGLAKLSEAKRLMALGNTLRYVRYFDDFPHFPLSNLWDDTVTSGFSDPKVYVVQTNPTAIQRCILMTTDPGDLVLDPTCGSGTTAYVAEQWGRRWITTDTSRIALNIAKTRLLSATFPYYLLYDQQTCDLRQGFTYRKVPHITLGSIANGEPPAEETLYDQPQEDKKRLRVAGPFTVETLQNYEPISPEELARQRDSDTELASFEDLIFAHLQSAGVKTGDKKENAVFTRIDRLASADLHAEGWYPAAGPLGRAVGADPIGGRDPGAAPQAGLERALGARIAGDTGGAGAGNADAGGAPRPSAKGATQASPGQRPGNPAPPSASAESASQTTVEKKAYLYIGPKFGTVSKQAVGEAIKACRDRRDGDWLLILGFAFESGITELSRHFGSFQVSIVRMHDDLLQQGLLKKDKKAASFVTIGEPDIRLERDSDRAVVEIAGLDIYDPIKDEVKSRDVQDIHYWMLDDQYDGSNFIVRQVFFCGGDKAEFADWRKGLSKLAEAATKKRAEQTLKLQIDEEAFAAIYGHRSRPFAVKPGQKIAVRVVSQFGEETTKVLEVK